MREVTGSTWTFQLIILFILIFACFLTLVINYSKAYMVKNEFLSIVEKYEGATDESIDIINNYLNEKGYKTKGSCPDGWYGAVDMKGTIEEADAGSRYFYCFVEEGQEKQIYYKVKLFYKFNLPVIGELATFQVNGRSNSFIGSEDRIGD